MKIRKATLDDLDAITAVEAACFPPAEAATRESFERRLRSYAAYFWLMENEAGELIAFVDGPVTKEAVLLDEMYADPSFHDEAGAWQMIFGVNTLPPYRRRGYAGQLLRQAIEEARSQGRRGCVLTCKDALVHYYASFGFQDEGISESTHGGAVWHDMRLTF